MSSLKKRVAHQRESLLERSTDIRQHSRKVKNHLGKIGVELEALEWRDGRVMVQFNLRLGIVLILAGIGALVLMKSETRT